jgi:hypothetical protein
LTLLYLPQISIKLCVKNYCKKFSFNLQKNTLTNVRITSVKKSLIKIIWKVHSYKNNFNTFEPKNVQFPDSSIKKLLTVTLTTQTQIKRLGKNKKINSGKPF